MGPNGFKMTLSYAIYKYFMYPSIHGVPCIRIRSSQTSKHAAPSIWRNGIQINIRESSRLESRGRWALIVTFLVNLTWTGKDAWFVIDIALNFRTGIIEENSHNEIIIDARAIRKKYFRGWFFIGNVLNLTRNFFWWQNNSKHEKRSNIYISNRYICEYIPKSSHDRLRRRRKCVWLEENYLLSISQVKYN